MDYRAVNGRCAVDIPSLELPILQEEALAILARKGFSVAQVDLIAHARACVNRAHYRHGARPSEAPSVVDCSSFVKWLYGLRGIWLPRRTIQQREYGTQVRLEEVRAADLVFVSGWINYYREDPEDGVGHVGIATGEGTVIHAANRRVGVRETPMADFLDGRKFRGARRYIGEDVEVITFETPPDREVEIADDIRWIVLQSLTTG